MERWSEKIGWWREYHSRKTWSKRYYMCFKTIILKSLFKNIFHIFWKFYFKNFILKILFQKFYSRNLVSEILFCKFQKTYYRRVSKHVIWNSLLRSIKWSFWKFEGYTEKLKDCWKLKFKNRWWKNNEKIRSTNNVIF